MDQHDHLVLFEAKSLGNLRLKNLFDVLHFEEVIPAAKRAQLRAPALLRAIGNLPGVGAIETPVLFAKFDVRRLANPALHHPARALFEHAIESRVIQRQRPFGTRARRDVAEQLIDQFAQERRHVFARQ